MGIRRELKTGVTRTALNRSNIVILNAITEQSRMYVSEQIKITSERVNDQSFLPIVRRMRSIPDAEESIVRES